jgi:hypothetical protein
MFLRRSVVATEILQTAVPCGVYLISGSRPRYPTMVILLNDDIVNSPLLYRVKLCGGVPDRRCSVFINRKNLSPGHKT